MREHTILTSFPAALTLVPSTRGFTKEKRSCILAKMILHQGSRRDSEGFRTMISLMFFVFLVAKIEAFLLTLLVIQLSVRGEKKIKVFFALINGFLDTVSDSILSDNNEIRKIDKRRRFSDSEWTSSRSQSTSSQQSTHHTYQSTLHIHQALFSHK